MKQLSSIFLLLCVVLFVSCNSNNSVGEDLGKVRYYHPFLWKSYDKSLNPLPSQTLQIERLEDEARQTVRLELVYKNNAKDATYKPISEIMDVWVDEGEYPIKENVIGKTCIEIRAGETEKVLRFQFRDGFKGDKSKKIEDGKYVISLLLDDKGDVEILNDDEPRVGMEISDCEWMIEYEVIMNPLAVLLIWVLVIIFSVFLIWMLILKRLIFPTFAFDNLQIAYYEGESRRGLDGASLRGARKVICTTSARRQNGLNKLFCGRVEYIENKFWECDVELLPRGSSGISFVESTQAGERSHYRRERAMITSQNSVRKPYVVQKFRGEGLAKISIG